MIDGNSATDEKRIATITCCVLAVIGVAAGVVLSPAWVVRFGSDDGNLGEHTRAWLIRYRTAAWLVGSSLGALAISIERNSHWRRRANALVPRIAAAVASVVLSALALEVACRTLESEEVRERGRRDAASFARGFMRLVAPQLNSDGFRDEPFDRPRSEGQRRILVLGDSFAFGFGVLDRASTFCARLELELAADTRVDVFNASFPGADTARELEIARATIDRVDPDLVLIAWHVNDAESEADKRSYVEQSRAVPLISDVLLRRSALWRVIEPALVAIAIDRGWKRRYVDHLRALHDPPSGARWSQRREFESLLDESRRGGRRAAVALFPLLEDFANYPLRDVHGLVARACAARGIATLDLRDALAREPAESLQVDAFDHHLNPKGNALAARAVADFVRNQGLLPPH